MTVFAGNESSVRLVFLLLLISCCYGGKKIEFTDKRLSVTNGLYQHRPNEEFARSLIECATLCAATENPCVGFRFDHEPRKCRLLTYVSEEGEEFHDDGMTMRLYFRQSDKLLARRK